MTTVTTGAILLLLALPLTGGGIWLAALGGSWAYLLMGLAVGTTGVLLWRHRRAAWGLYAALLLATAVWALWEVGLDRWQLIPRGALLAVVGLWLVTPWVARGLLMPPDTAEVPGQWPLPRLALACALVVAAAIALLSLTHDPVLVKGELSPRAATGAVPDGPPVPADDWVAYGGNGLGQRYSALTDITPDTVSRLRHAWTFHTGDRQGDDDPTETTYQVTPLKIGATLYLCTPSSLLIALDAASGEERWRYDPGADVGPSSQHKTCRGLGYHDADANGRVEPPHEACRRRVILPTIDARLVALDAASGQPCAEFGQQGVLNLAVNMPHLEPGSYMLTSPPVVTRELIVVGSSINDNVRGDNPSGVIRAFDVRTGQLMWNWHAETWDDPAPLPDGELYPAGGPNSWSIGSADEALGLVYLPLANRSPDLLGERRSDAVDRFSSSVLALELATGRVRWHFQTVRHDLWDRDVPSQPTLLDLMIGGERVPALIQPTKQGDVYVLDRRDGRPLVGVSEMVAPTDGVAGERPAPSQPVSALSFMPPPLIARDMWGATPLDQLWCRIQYRRMRYDGPYTPPGHRTSLVYPGNTGVFNWGGVAVDPVRELLVGSPVRLAFTHRLVPRDDPDANLVSDGLEPFNENYGGKFAFEMGPFVSPLGLPCQAPPWGLLAGVDLRSGDIVWQRRNGTVRDSLPAWLPLPLPMGVASLGGPLLTAGGVMFFSGTLDQYLRAYEAVSGRLLWQARLPAGGQATPMTYRAGGRQMVVVAAGGHGSLGTKTGDALVAFSLE